MWSSATRGAVNSDAELLSIGLTPSPARVGAGPVLFLRGSLDYRGSFKRWQLGAFERELLERAEAVHLWRKRGGGGPIRVEPLRERAIDYGRDLYTWDRPAMAAGVRPAGRGTTPRQVATKRVLQRGNRRFGKPWHVRGAFREGRPFFLESVPGVTPRPGAFPP